MALRGARVCAISASSVPTWLECAALASQTDAPDQPTWLEAEVDREYAQVHQAALDDTILYSNAVFEQAIVDLQTFAHNRPAIVQAQVAAVRGE